MGKEVTQLVGFRVLAEERYTTKRETRGADERVVPGENSTSREDEDGEEAKGGKRRKKKKKRKTGIKIRATIVSPTPQQCKQAPPRSVVRRSKPLSCVQCS